MTHYIYKITNLLNNKIYIGQTNNPRSRWTCHKQHSSIKPDTAIDRAIAKYGHNNFIFEVIATCLSLGNNRSDQYLADEVEIHIIAQEKSQTINNIGYNVSSGGNKGKIVTENTKRKMSAARKGFCVSSETKRKISNFQKGKLKSEDHKIKIGKSQYWRTQQTRDLCINAISILGQATYAEICHYLNNSNDSLIFTRSKISRAVHNLFEKKIIQKCILQNRLISFKLNTGDL